MTRRILIPLALVLAAGCGETTPHEDPHAAQIAELTRAVEDLTASNAALGKEVRRQGRQLAGLGRDLAARNTASPAPAGDTATANASRDPVVGDEGVLSSAVPGEEASMGEEEAALGAMLASEAGQKAIQKATSREIARREEQERRGYVAYAVGMYAREAGLDEHTTAELQRIWKDSLDGGVALREQFAAIGSLPESERKAARQEAMQTMRNLGKERRDKAADLLGAERYAEYEKADEEIVESLHGGPRPSGRRR